LLDGVHLHIPPIDLKGGAGDEEKAGRAWGMGVTCFQSIDSAQSFDFLFRCLHPSYGSEGGEGGGEVSE
jgi:hypothetical protein